MLIGLFVFVFKCFLLLIFCLLLTWLLVFAYYAISYYRGCNPNEAEIKQREKKIWLQNNPEPNFTVLCFPPYWLTIFVRFFLIFFICSLPFLYLRFGDAGVVFPIIGVYFLFAFLGRTRKAKDNELTAEQNAEVEKWKDKITKRFS
jgi:hypothetical protein